MAKEEIVNTFIADLEDALHNIHEVYHGLEYWKHTEDYLATYGPLAQKFLQPYLRRYHERVFCYELYHQLRLRMENRLEGNESLYKKHNIFLQSELVKSKINTFIEIVYSVKRLRKEYMPDFLLHSPGDFSNQLIVIEAKSNPKLDKYAVIRDLEKINEFIDRFQYNTGIFIGINVSKTSQDYLVDEISNWKNRVNPHSSQMILYFKENPQSKFDKYNIADI